MRIAITADHNGLHLKGRLVDWLTSAGHEVDDRGPIDPHEIVDYPPLCIDVCRQVVRGRADRGIVLGGSGMGEVIACNKMRGIRAGLCSDLWSTSISRGNNDSNVLVLAAKVIDPELAVQVLYTWLDTRFKGGVHQDRLEQIAALERSQS